MAVVYLLSMIETAVYHQILKSRSNHAADNSEFGTTVSIVTLRLIGSTCKKLEKNLLHGLYSGALLDFTAVFYMDEISQLQGLKLAKNG